MLLRDTTHLLSVDTILVILSILSCSNDTLTSFLIDLFKPQMMIFLVKIKKVLLWVLLSHNLETLLPGSTKDLVYEKHVYPAKHVAQTGDIVADG